MPSELQNLQEAMDRLGKLLGREIKWSDDYLLNIIEVLEKQQEQINDYLAGK